MLRNNCFTFHEPHKIKCVENMQNNLHAKAGGAYRIHRALILWRTDKCILILQVISGIFGEQYTV